MKRRSRFLTGFTAAALTFGTLMLTLGPQKFGGNCTRHGHHHGYCHNQPNAPANPTDVAK